MRIDAARRPARTDAARRPARTDAARRPARTDTVGLILAGGLARRMGGGDKPLRRVGGRTVLARVVDALRPQVGALLLNANGDPARFAEYALPVVPDPLPDYPGPLAGVLAGLEWAVQHPGTDWVLSVPGDAPFLPADLADRLHAARLAAGTALACAASGGWTHPVAALWPVAIAPALRAALTGGLRKIDAFTAAHGITEVEWPVAPVDPFFNANRPEDLAEAERIAASLERFLPG